MSRIAFAVVTLLVCCASPARAETILLVEGVPATYVPGQEFTFSLRVPAIPGLTGYQVFMEFSTDFDTAPLLASPTIATPGPGPNSYVFASNSRFGFNFSAPEGGEVATLRISDPFDPQNGPNPAVNTRPGLNDTLATITVKPFAELTGPITLSFSTEFQYNRSEAPAFESVEPFVIEQGSPPGPDPVPAPPGVVLLGVGGLLLVVRSRLTRRAA